MPLVRLTIHPEGHPGVVVPDDEIETLRIQGLLAGEPEPDPKPAPPKPAPPASAAVKPTED